MKVESGDLNTAVVFSYLLMNPPSPLSLTPGRFPTEVEEKTAVVEVSRETRARRKLCFILYCPPGSGLDPIALDPVWGHLY